MTFPHPRDVSAVVLAGAVTLGQAGLTTEAVSAARLSMFCGFL